MSALAALAIVAGILLLVVLLVAVATAVRTRVMQDRDLELAEALAGEETPPPELRAPRRSKVSRSVAEERRILEQAIPRWVELNSRVRNALVESAASRWGETPEELSSLSII